MNEINVIGTELCAFCIAVMRLMEDWTDLSYGLINVLLFVILGPLSTITGLIAAFAANTNHKTISKVFIGITIFIILLVIIPIGITLIECVFVAFGAHS